jgi:predicted ester cyclase
MTDAETFVHHYIDDFINGGNATLVDELFTPDVTFRDPVFPGGVVRGLDALKASLAAAGAALGGLRFVPEHILEKGDMVGWHGSMQGTRNGRQVVIPLAEFYRLVDGKIADAWVYLDMQALTRQLGGA